MKNYILLSIIILSAILFIDIIIMITMGFVTSHLGFTHLFYECTYCFIAKFVLLASVASSIYILVNLHLKSKNNNLSIK